MFTVDRHQFTAAASCRRRDQTARHHQRLLVGQRHALARVECRQRRAQPGGTDNGVDDGFDIVARRS